MPGTWRWRSALTTGRPIPRRCWPAGSQACRTCRFGQRAATEAGAPVTRTPGMLCWRCPAGVPRAARPGRGRPSGYDVACGGLMTCARGGRTNCRCGRRDDGRVKFNVEAVRACYPALADGYAYLDGAAGTQVPAAVIDAISQAQSGGLGNSGGAFPASQRADAITAASRAAVAALT